MVLLFVVVTKHRGVRLRSKDSSINKYQSILLILSTRLLLHRSFGGWFFHSDDLGDLGDLPCPPSVTSKVPHEGSLGTRGSTRLLSVTVTAVRRCSPPAGCQGLALSSVASTSNALFMKQMLVQYRRTSDRSYRNPFSPLAN